MDSIYDLTKFAVNTKYEDLPKQTVKCAKTLLTDIVAATVCGTTADMCPEVAQLMFDWGGKPESSVLVYGKKLPAPHAAFFNSMLAHARDYDEYQPDYIVHTGVSVIPTAIAIAEAMGNVSGKDLLSSIVLSVDIMIRMARAITAPISQLGWIYSPLLGHFGSALCASLLMGLNEEQTANALGIVYSQAAGNQQASADTARTKGMQPAFAARSGVFSAYLAKVGVTGAKNVLDGQYGFFKLYIRDMCDKSTLTQDLGKTFLIPTLSYKPHPVCGLSLSSVDTTCKIMSENNIKLEEIQDIEVGVTTQTMDIVVQPFDVKVHPKTTVDAMFSIPYAVASAAVRGNVLLNDLTPEAIRDPAVISVAEKVHAVIDQELEAKYSRGVAPTKVTIKTARGSFTDCIVAKGNPKNPLSEEDMRNKLLDAMNFGLYPSKAGAGEKLLDMIDNLEDLDDVRVLIDAINDSFVK